jgi:hypothetical protein
MHRYRKANGTVPARLAGLLMVSLSICIGFVGPAAADWTSDSSFNPRNGITTAQAVARNDWGAVFELTCRSDRPGAWEFAVPPLTQFAPERLCIDVDGNRMCGSITEDRTRWRAGNLNPVLVERLAAGRSLSIRPESGGELAGFSLAGSRRAIEAARAACGF